MCASSISLRRASLVLPLALSVAALVACPAPTDPCAPVAASEDEEATAGGEGAAYGGDGNDEVWVTLYDARERATTGGDAAVVVKPAAGESLPADGAPPVFEWSSALKITLGPWQPSSPLRGAPRPLFDRALAAASRALIPQAHAHLPPVTSDAYLLEVVVPGKQCPVSIVTTELTHTLDEGTWGALKEAAGQDLTLRITSAYLASGRVTEGPFRSDDVSFRVE